MAKNVAIRSCTLFFCAVCIKIDLSVKALELEFINMD